MTDLAQIQVRAAINSRSSLGLATENRILPAPRDRGPLPLSLFQQRLWFLEQLVPNNPAYIVPEETRFKGVLNREALRRALDEIIRRHESLRTRFAGVANNLVQLIDPPYPADLSVQDLSSLPPEQREEEARCIVFAESRKPFDLQRGPILRTRLLVLGQEENILLITMHHIVADVWSLKVLLNEMQRLYSAFSQGKPSPLPELPIQYADFAVWQNLQFQNGGFEEHLAYWRTKLKGISELNLLTDKPRPAMQGFSGASYRFQWPLALSSALRILSQQEGVTLYMLLLAAFQAFLQRYTQSEDIAVVTPSTNRDRPEIEGLIGFFVNTLVLRSSCSPSQGFRAFLADVRDTALNGYAHQEVPFEKLVEELHPSRDLSRNPLAQIAFGFDSASIPADFGGLHATVQSIDNSTAKFDLFLSLRLKAEGIGGRIEYNTDLFEAGTMVRMAGHLERLVEGIVADPDCPIGMLPLLREEERRQIVEEWNRTERAV
ncbi:MAG TPA: condensation domain-containing protein, partial [Candidatus Angelobacter sp.]|nr:condensation domain-containing protein [Candidatus Angelobacter sp.]